VIPESQNGAAETEAGRLQAQVALEIPGRPEYVGVARLAILGVASRMRFSYDEVEDIRLAVGEACTRAIEQLERGGEPGARVRLRCLVDANRLTIEVRNPLTGAGAAAPREPFQPSADGELGGVLIRILMDEVETEELSEEGMQVLRMIKYAT
jgi:serine/threonine-protein kinase RsbW